MPRRPQSFRAYARRRWRLVGFGAVLLAGALLVLALTDRGHEPTWSVRGGTVTHLALSPDGSAVYALTSDGGRITGLEARRGDDGGLRWQSPLDASRALLRAGDGWVAVATDFPRAFLTVYGDDSSVRYQVALEGNPRAMAGEGARIAIALQAPHNPVLLFESGEVVRVHRFSSFVSALDLRGGVLAVGTGLGNVEVLGIDGESLLNTTLPVGVRSLRLSADGSRLAVGGASLAPGDLSGMVVLLEPGARTPQRWSYATPAGIGFVDLDATGAHVLTVEETALGNRLHLFDAAQTPPRWSRTMGGEIAKDGAARAGGAALSPDGRHVAVGTIGGEIRLLDAQTGLTRWTYASAGTTTVAFPSADAGRLLANGRLAPQGPYAALFSFDVHEEPFQARLAALALLATGVIATVVLGALVVGYWRLRRA